jgi:hypothetical protein
MGGVILHPTVPVDFFGCRRWLGIKVGAYVRQRADGLLA